MTDPTEPSPSPPAAASAGRDRDASVDEPAAEGAELSDGAGAAEPAPVAGEQPSADETVPAETVPAETVPAETVPDETVADETVPDETPPEESADAGVPSTEAEVPVDDEAQVAPVGEAGDQDWQSGELEWQPVYDGDQISWQPVVSSEADEDWPTAEELVHQWEGQPATPDYEAAAGADWGVPDPDDVESVATAAPTRRPGPRRPPNRRPPAPDPRAKQRRMVILLSVLTGVVAVVAVTGYVVGTGITKQTEGGPATPPTTSNTAPTLPESEFTTFRDELTGLSVKYPKTWRRVGQPVADVRLQVDGGGQEGMRIRVLPIETPATMENIRNFKAVTDGIAFSNPDNKLVKSQLIQVNGRLAYYYLYTYRDAPTGMEGVHAHYFIFEGHRMFTMVLQCVPAEDFPRLAGIFDQIAESFTVPEERLLSTTTSTP